jgi:hypothetical protein
MDSTTDKSVVLLQIIFLSSLLMYQNHFWYHCNGCFQNTARTPEALICRFFKPDSPEEFTRYLASLSKLILQKDIGSEYLNDYIPIIASIFKCNHDLKFLYGSVGVNVIFYIVKYVTKAQQKIDNIIALFGDAFMRRYKKTDDMIKAGEIIDDECKGKSLLYSALWRMTNIQQTGAPMIALYILRGPMAAFYHGIPQTKLHIFKDLALLGAKDVNQEIHVSLGHNVISYNSNTDYFGRPLTHESMCRYALEMQLRAVPKARKNSIVVHHTFCSSHAKSDSHIWEVLSTPRQLHIIGPSLTCSHDHSTPEATVKSETFYTQMCYLFKPHRTLSDLQPVSSDTYPWETTFLDYLTFAQLPTSPLKVLIPLTQGPRKL